MKWIFVGIIVFCNTLGDLLNTIGMRRNGVVHTGIDPRGIARFISALVRNRFVLAGIGASAVSFFTLIRLLSVADVSFAIPATAGSFVLEAVLAKLVLREDVRWERWVGATVIAVGVGLLVLP